MYLQKVMVKTSNIEGRGVFTEENITMGDIVWRFDAHRDRVLTQEQYELLDEAEKADIRKVGYVSPTTNLWVYPPEEDAARFTNHSEINNNLTAKFDRNVSSESFFVAKRDIKQGEELVVNYFEFDASIKQGRPEWMQP